jgi:hypothetical protein
VRKVCKEVGITDGATIYEITRRHHAMVADTVQKSFRLGFDSPENAAFTLAHLENTIPRPIPWDVQRFVKALLEGSLELGVDIDQACPRLTKAMRMEAPRREASAYLQQPSFEPSGAYDDRLFKSERPVFRLGRKLLRPYLECRVHDCVLQQISSHVFEQQAVAKAVGYGGDHPPIAPLDIQNHAEYVWADLVKTASVEDADPNLVAALQLAGRAWVVATAAQELREHMSKLGPRFSPTELGSRY